MAVEDRRRLRTRLGEIFSHKRFYRPALPLVSDGCFSIIGDVAGLEGFLFIHQFAQHIGNLFQHNFWLLFALRKLGMPHGPHFGVRLV